MQDGVHGALQIGLERIEPMIEEALRTVRWGGVVHQDVETAVCFFREFDERFNVGFFGHVGADKRGSASLGFDQAHGFVATRFRDVRNYDGAAF